MIILRFLGSSDDKEKEKIGVARPKASDGSRKNRRHGTLVQKGVEAKSAYRHRLNRRVKKEASVHWASYVPETMSSA